MSAPSPPSTVTGIGPVKAHAGADRVVAAERVDVDVVESRLVPGHRDARGQAGDHRVARGGADVDVVGVVGAVRDDRVGRAVAGAVEGVEVDVGGVEVGAGEVVDRDGVGAAEGADGGALDAVEVHRDPGDVAVQDGVRPVGGEVDLLGGVGAVEGQRVLAALAVDGVAAVAGIPLEGVVAGAELGGVGADVAVDEVVARVADEGLGAVAADERVVAGAAVDGDVLQGGRRVLDADRVVAAAGVDGDGGEGGCGRRTRRADR